MRVSFLISLCRPRLLRPYKIPLFAKLIAASPTRPHSSRHFSVTMPSMLANANANAESSVANESFMRKGLGSPIENDAGNWTDVPGKDGAPGYSVYSVPIQKSASDDRSYRLVRLANGLEAVLVHDPTTDKAAASLDVAVGHLSDPVSISLIHALLLQEGVKDDKFFVIKVGRAFHIAPHNDNESRLQ